VQIINNKYAEVM